MNQSEEQLFKIVRQNLRDLPAYKLDPKSRKLLKSFVEYTSRHPSQAANNNFKVQHTVKKIKQFFYSLWSKIVFPLGR